MEEREERERRERESGKVERGGSVYVREYYQLVFDERKSFAIIPQLID